MNLDYCHLSQQMDGFELVRFSTMDLPDLWSTGFPISQTPMPHYPDTFSGFFSSAREELNPVQLLSNQTVDGQLGGDPTAHNPWNLNSECSHNLPAPLEDLMVGGTPQILSTRSWPPVLFPP
jgi:hypothetical protein